MVMSPIVGIVFGCMQAQVVYTAAELGVADHLAAGPRTSEELARATGTHEPSLRRLLRALAGLGLLTQCEPDRPDRYALSALGRQLCGDAPDSAREMVRLLAGPESWRAWGDLIGSVRTGEPSWDRVTGMSFFEFLDRHADKATTFNAGMAAYTRSAAPGLVAAHDFARFDTVVDIGGGNGTLLAEVLRAEPHVTGVVFDTATALAEAPRVLAEAGVADRCQTVAGDFFAAVPEGGDAYVLKSVLHDWDDERALAILANCRAAMGPDARLLVIERLLPDLVTPDVLAWLLGDVEMMILPGGIERTESDYRDLLAAAGFAVVDVSDPQPEFGHSLVEAAPK